MTRRELLAATAWLPLLPRALWAGVSRAHARMSRRAPTRCLAPDASEGGCAMPYSGGVVRVGPRSLRHHLRLYYLSNFRDLSLATSDDDGRSWQRRGVCLRPEEPVDSISVAHDNSGPAPDPYPFKAIATAPGAAVPRYYVSRDGLSWVEVDGPQLAVGDRSSIAWFRGQWLLFARRGGGTGGDPRRFALYRAEAFPYFALVASEWLRAAPGDGARGDGGDPQLYGVDLLDGDGALALTIWRGHEPGRPKLNDVCLARLRPDLSVAREDFAPVAVPGPAGAWCWGNVQGVGGGLVGRRLLVSARAGDARGGNGPCATGYVDLP